ncbi:MAG: elongation factor Ts [Candidatus Pacebacteria bacterium GW2011_GWF2_38_9]|nr:MAG: Translation elongation factor EFTs/EF1B dimerization, elongation factor Ts [candidate division TM6 bacterium GW2011_GWF2_28_16]KKQ89101.1 MAG: elongation factor Ts [Candidatus Pacebacteria bacterium GW2011_GWF2_38_9]HAZ73601.1 translation elongation factor Ts [Candidatus Paceibacterota bacterium]
MPISMDQIKKLRELTGARILDCQKALQEADGDLDKAVAAVEAKGLAKADKIQDRETKVGYIATYTHNTGMVAAMVEMLCETDFVAANEEFRQMVRDIAMQVAAMGAESVEDLLQQDSIKDSEKTIELVIKTLSGKIGEKMTLSRFERYAIES